MGERSSDAAADGTSSRPSFDPRDVEAKNVSGSTAGSGSGDFHVYRQERRREMIRIEKLQEEAQQRAAKEEGMAEALARKEREEKRTERRASKRKRKKERAAQNAQKKKKVQAGDGGGDSIQTGDCDAPQQQSADVPDAQRSGSVVGVVGPPKPPD